MEDHIQWREVSINWTDVMFNKRSDSFNRRVYKLSPRRGKRETERLVERLIDNEETYVDFKDIEDLMDLSDDNS